MLWLTSLSGDNTLNKRKRLYIAEGSQGRASSRSKGRAHRGKLLSHVLAL